MPHVFHVGAYVKLAKLWERKRDEAIAYHREYHALKCAANARMRLYDVYIDITGQKEIGGRPAMLRLLRDCQRGKVDCVAAQTGAYLAANPKELCFLMKFLFDMENWVEIVTEADSYQIDTIRNLDGQREALVKMADDFARLEPSVYGEWKRRIQERINRLDA